MIWRWTSAITILDWTLLSTTLADFMWLVRLETEDLGLLQGSYFTELDNKCITTTKRNRKMIQMEFSYRNFNLIPIQPFLICTALYSSYWKYWIKSWSQKLQSIRGKTAFLQTFGEEIDILVITETHLDSLIIIKKRMT